MLQIVKAPHPILSETAKKVRKIDQPILALIHEMIETLTAAKDPEGVGLAAPQVGQPLQLFIIRQTPQSLAQVFLNPVLHTPPAQDQIDVELEKMRKRKNRRQSSKLEGCLSLNNIWGMVKRHPSVVLEYQDEKGTMHKRRFSGFIATIIQHEYDHLQGTLFPKRVLEQNGKLYKSSKNEKNETIFEQIAL